MKSIAIALAFLFAGCTSTKVVVVTTTVVTKKAAEDYKMDGDLYPSWVGDIGIKDIGEKTLQPDKTEQAAEGYNK